LLDHLVNTMTATTKGRVTFDLLAIPYLDGAGPPSCSAQRSYVGSCSQNKPPAWMISPGEADFTYPMGCKSGLVGGW
jgi:hypothetical protein